MIKIIQIMKHSTSRYYKIWRYGMKYDEVIRDFREVYRERVGQYAERFIQQCYIGTTEGRRGLKEDKAGNRYFEIDFEEFLDMMKELA